MFYYSIKYLGSDKQNKRWMDKILSYEWLGCYAQTELAHGSDVQSLLTTARFEKST